jgi:hypothetical protein
MQQCVEIPKIIAVDTAPVSLPHVVDGVVVSVKDDYQPPKPSAPRWRGSMPFLAALALFGLALGVAAALLITPWLTASATVILTPSSRTLRTDVAIVAGPTTHSEVYADLFPAERQSLSRTVATTGTATQPAAVAHGSITFYNALPSPQTIAAGTLLMSASGVPVLTEEVADIPAGTGSANGMTTVSAQAENSGPEGNITANDIRGPCCRAYVLAYSSAFSGGREARTYHTPTAADIAMTSTPLTQQVDNRMQRTLRAQLQAGEVMLPPKCATTPTSSAEPGTEAEHVTVTAVETCSTAAYHESDLEAAATGRLSALAVQQLGARYQLSGRVDATITSATVTSDLVTFHLHLSGVYAYSFNQQQMAQLRSQLLGVSRDRARVILDHLAGMTHVQIQSSDATLPSDPGRIHILLAQ